MQQKATSPVKALSILHIALFIGQLLFGIIALVVVSLRKFQASSLQEYSQTIIVCCLIVGALGYLAGNGLFKRKIEQINRENKPVSQKLNDYRAASISRWVMLEAPILLCIVFFLRTSNYTIIAIADLLLLIFFSTRPAASKIASDLEISEADLEQTNEPDL